MCHGIIAPDTLVGLEMPLIAMKPRRRHVLRLAAGAAAMAAA